MTYILHGDRRSGSCTVELALAQIGAAVELRDVSLEHDAQRGENYASLNPSRKVPSLITAQGEILTESVAILLTLDERHPRAALLPPPGDPQRAQALRWLCFIATELYPLVEISDYPERFCPVGGDAEGTRERARAMWRQRWSIVEGAVSGDPWFLPSGFSLVDIYISVVSQWTRQGDWRTRSLPRVIAICRAIAARPACAAVWARHFD